MSGHQYPSDVQFAGLIQAATAAADAQERNVSVLGKRTRDQDDSMIDTQLRDQTGRTSPNAGQLSENTQTLQSSASVLFREPSEKSKKYSRPPLGKVYLDLQLAPETFLRLQNAAKDYMLDEEHMERRDVVGHKKNSSNNDVAKLRLWGCVEDFLLTDDNGEKFFGQSAGEGIPNSPVRTIFWPQDGQKIVKQCMPLFRKMVTNERQRIYASETRKQEPNKTEKNKKPDARSSSLAKSSDFSPAPTTDNPLPDRTLEEQTLPQDEQQNTLDARNHLTLHINIVTHENGSSRRLVPRFSVSSNAVSTLTALLMEARKKYDVRQPIYPSSEQDWFIPTVKVWLPDGIVRIRDDGQWMVALLSAGMVDWMDSEIRVLIEVESVPSKMDT